MSKRRDHTSMVTDFSQEAEGPRIQGGIRQRREEERRRIHAREIGTECFMSANRDRAERAQLIFDHWVRLVYGDPAGLTPGDLETVLGDLAADLRHLARTRGWNADEQTGQGYFHFFCEVMMEEERWEPGDSNDVQDARRREIETRFREKVARLSAP